MKEAAPLLFGIGILIWVFWDMFSYLEPLLRLGGMMP